MVVVIPGSETDYRNATSLKTISRDGTVEYATDYTTNATVVIRLSGTQWSQTTVLDNPAEEKSKDLLEYEKKLAQLEKREEIYSNHYYREEKLNLPNIKPNILDIIRWRRMPRKGRYTRIL